MKPKLIEGEKQGEGQGDISQLSEKIKGFH